jgi:ubiquinone/menaquinone biosynthesis C-methylase UbiE
MHSIQAKIRGYRYRRYLPVLLELLSPKKDEVILDIGAGTGYIAHKVSELCDELYALEPNAGKVEEIRKHFPAVKAFVANAEQIPFPDSYFDKAFAVNSFHHFRDQDNALEEIARILKPNAYLVIHDGNRSRLSSSQCVESKISRELVRFMTPTELETMTRRHGFVIKLIRPVGNGYFMLATI